MLWSKKEYINDIVEIGISPPDVEKGIDADMQ
jgi:hypothetical protein